jgi:hypothetical protein
MSNPMPDGFPVDDAVEARDAVVDFWAALAADDDAAVRRLFFPASMIRNSLTPDGMAAQLRERLDETADQCRSMAVSNTVRVLPDGAWVFFSKRSWRPEMIAGPAKVEGHMLVVLRGDAGEWRVWGAPDAEDLAAAKHVALPADMQPEGWA